MRHTSLKWLNAIRAAHTRLTSSQTRKSTAFVAMLIAAVALAAAVRAYYPESKSVRPSKVATVSAPASPAASSTSQRRSLSRLAFQPEANKMRRRLGQRFVEPGRDVTVSTGILTTGSGHQPIRIVRTQDQEQGEQVSITIGANPAYAWSPKAGAVSNSDTLSGTERAIVERIALDSPDQFILAQTRGASYYTVARTVSAAEPGDADGSGPSWDLIRIAEPQHGNFNKPESVWRIYYINNSTGLIDRIFYQEQGEDVTVEMSGWTSRLGELAPSLIRWTRSKSIVMELNLSTVGYAPR